MQADRAKFADMLASLAGEIKNFAPSSLDDVAAFALRVSEE